MINYQDLVPQQSLFACLPFLIIWILSHIYRAFHGEAFKYVLRWKVIQYIRLLCLGLWVQILSVPSVHVCRYWCDECLLADSPLLPTPTMCHTWSHTPHTTGSFKATWIPLQEAVDSVRYLGNFEFAPFRITCSQIHYSVCVCLLYGCTFQTWLCYDHGTEFPAFVPNYFTWLGKESSGDTDILGARLGHFINLRVLGNILAYHQ